MIIRPWELYKEDEKFVEIWKELYQKHNNKIEPSRKRTMTIVYVGIIIIIIEIFALCVFSIQMKDKAMLVTSVLLFISIAIVFYSIEEKRNPKNREQIEYFKKNVIGALVKKQFPNLEYEINGSNLLFDEYKNNFIVHHLGCTGYPSDHIYGVVDDVKIDMCFINAVVNFGSSKMTDKEVFISSSKTKNWINNNICITPREMINILNLEDRIEIQNSEFNKVFEAYADSQILSANVLTDEFINLVVEFYKKYQVKFKIKIFENRLLIEFYSGQVFKPNIVQQTFDGEFLYFHYLLIEFMVNFTVKINKLLSK